MYGRYFTRSYTDWFTEGFTGIINWSCIVLFVSYRKIRSRGILIFLSLLSRLYHENIFQLLIFSNEKNLWINLFLQSSIPFIHLHTHIYIYFRIFITFIITMFIIFTAMYEIYYIINISKITHNIIKIFNLLTQLKKTSSSRFNFWTFDLKSNSDGRFLFSPKLVTE